MGTRGAQGLPRGFLPPRRELGGYAAFGFVLPSYTRRGPAEIRRVPTARATLYFARDVKRDPTSTELVSGVFCEGPHGKGFDVPAECGELIAVKVAAGGLRALLGVPAREVQGLTLSLDDVWGRSARELLARMLEARTAEARYAVLETELARRCRVFGAHDDCAVRAARLVERRRGCITGKDLRDVTGLTERTLRTRFDDWVGLGPKQLARVIRLRSAISRITATEEPDWAAFALECGFFDQAHLIHDFQSLLKMTPGEFVTQRRLFSPLGADAFGRRSLPRREQSLYQSLGLVSSWTTLGR